MGEENFDPDNPEFTWDQWKDMLIGLKDKITELEKKFDIQDGRCNRRKENNYNESQNIFGEIKELEKKFKNVKLGTSAKMINQNKIIADYTLLKERIEKLENRLNEFSSIGNGNINKITQLEKELSELKTKFNEFNPIFMYSEITEMKERTDRNDMFISRAINDEMRNRDVLRELFKQFKKLNWDNDSFIEIEKLEKLLGGENSVVRTLGGETKQGQSPMADLKPPSYPSPYDQEQENWMNKCEKPMNSRDAIYLHHVRKHSDLNPSEQEECEHNRPFWECEICGNVRKTKEIDRQTEKVWSCYSCGTGHSNCFEQVGRCINGDKWFPKEVAEPYPSPYSKEQKDFGKYIQVEKEDLINYKMKLEEIKTFIINHAYVQANLKISILLVELKKYMSEKED